MTITNAQETLDGIVKVSCEDGSSYLLRLEYLPPDGASLLRKGAPLTPEEDGVIYAADAAARAERYALKRLACAEYCRRQLEIKLKEKKFPRNAAKAALDFLEASGWIDDRRFCDQWLRRRTARSPEGRAKLLAGLLERGVTRGVADASLDDFTLEFPEKKLLFLAADKLLRRRGRSNREIDFDGAFVRSLMNKGFGERLIRDAIKEIGAL